MSLYDCKTGMILTLPFWDHDSNKEVWKTVSLESLIENPANVCLEHLGLHIINVMRINKGLEPLEHVMGEK